MTAAPSYWMLAVSLLGGIGLFLLGMTMLTDGLKLAAGRALERILAKMPDVVFCDLKMPRMDGNQLVLAARARGYIRSGWAAWGP